MDVHGRFGMLSKDCIFGLHLFAQTNLLRIYFTLEVFLVWTTNHVVTILTLSEIWNDCDETNIAGSALASRGCWVEGARDNKNHITAGKQLTD